MTLWFSMLLFSVNAQQRISFSDAIDMAMDNNKAISSAKYGVATARSEQMAVKGMRAPQLELIGGYTLMQQNINIDLGGARGVVTESLESLINKGVTGGLISPTIATLLGDGLAPIKDADWSYTLQKRNFGFVGSSFTMPIYLGGSINIANRVSELNVKSATNILDGVESHLITELVDRYYGVVLAREVVRVRNLVVEGVKQHLQNALAMEEEGLVAHSVILYLEYKLSEAERERAESESKLQIATLALKSTLQSDDDILPVDNMFIVPGIKDLEYYRENALKYSTIIREADLAKNLSVEGVNMARSELLPKIVAMGGVSIYSHNLSEIVPRWAVGVGASIPLFGGFSLRNKLQSARYISQSVDDMVDRAQEDVLLLVDKEYYTLQNSLLDIKSCGRSITFAESYYNTALEGFYEGVTSSSDLMDARIALAGARVEYLNSVYNYTISLARLLELSGLSQEFVVYKLDAEIVHINDLIY